MAESPVPTGRRVYVADLGMLADALDVRLGTLQQWVREGGAPVRAPEGYHVGTYAGWLRERARGSKRGKLTATERLKTLQGDREELRLARDRGEVIDRKEHERIVASYNAAHVQTLESIPAMCAPVVAGKSARAAMEAMRDQCRKRREQLFGVDDGDDRV